MAVLTQTGLTAEVIANVRSAGAGGLTTAANVRQLTQDIVDTLFAGDNANNTLITELNGQVVMLTGAQVIAGIKTFTVLPQSGATPENPQDLTTLVWVNAQIAAAIAGLVAGGAFDSSTPIKRQIPGMQGAVLGGTTVIEALQEFFYPVQAPLVSLSIPSPYHEYGDAGDIPVTWEVVKIDQPIDTITVGGTAITPTGDTQSGVQNVAGGAMGSTTISIVGGSEGSLASASVVSQISKKIRVGGCANDGIVLAITDANINALTGFFAPNGYAGFGNRITVGAGQYFVIEVPVSMGVPLMYVDGVRWNFVNTIRSNAAFVNNFGYSDEVNVWASLVQLPGTYYVQFF